METHSIKQNQATLGQGCLTVLVAEDESLIGTDLSDTLESAGYVVIGPLAGEREAVAAVEAEPPDLAVIDVMLKDGPCVALMATLRRCGVPFLVHSGYRRAAVKVADHGDELWLDKPAVSHDLLLALGRLEQAIRRGDPPSAELMKPVGPSPLRV